LKIKDPKLFLFLIPFVAVVGFLVNADKKTPLEFEANGIVALASWEGKNHGMPLFVIRQNNQADTKRKLESNDVSLTPEQIKVGDTFVKYAGSRACIINKVEIACVK
jgi:hypothetical protein